MRRILTVTLNPTLDVSTETERIAPELKLRCAEPRRDPGGGGANVSRAVAALGGATVPVVAVGGATGDHVLALLRGEGLDPVVIAAPGETRESFSVRDLSANTQYRFLTPGARWTPDQARAAADAVAGAAREGDVVVASGSLPPGVEPRFFLDLAARLAEVGAGVILDTSGPALEAAAAWDGPPLMALRMDDAEAEALAGAVLPTPADTAGFAAGLVAGGVATLAAVARGAEGTVVASAEGRWLCRPPKVEVVSKIGAGDSFVAGFALALCRGEPPAAACALGVAAAAATVTTPDTRLCDAETVARLLPGVATTPL